jgi:hypothetical protein
MKIPRLHYHLLEPVLGKSITRNELRLEIGPRTHLSKESIDVLVRDAKDMGIIKQERNFRRLTVSDAPKPKGGLNNV